MVASRATAGGLGPLEADVMAVLWAADRPLRVREVLDTINRDRSPGLAYTTVMTVMTRLAEKQILTRERDGRSYRYQAAVDDPAAVAVRGVVRAFGDAAVAGFLDEARANPKLLRRLQALLDEQDDR